MKSKSSYRLIGVTSLLVSLAASSHAVAADDAQLAGASSGGSGDLGPPTQAIAGMVQTHVVPYFQSTSSTAAAVLVQNLSNQSCSYGVEWYFKFNQPDGLPECTVTGTLGGFLTGSFVNDQALNCSRALPSSNVADCDAPCSPELTFNTGKAVVYFDENCNAAEMAVEARQYHLSDVNDFPVDAVHNIPVKALFDGGGPGFSQGGPVTPEVGGPPGAGHGRAKFRR